MQLYELNYLLDLNKKGKEAKKIETDIEGLIQDKEGILTRRRKERVKDLGYPIKEQSKAISVSSEFQMNPNRIPEFQNELNKFPLLRIMLEKKKRRKKKKRRARTSSKDEKEIKVELDKIEKKLDEILDES